MYAKRLQGRVFTLGRVLYVVAHDQSMEGSVRCYREVDNVVSIVRLPIVFVLEQLADEIPMSEPA